MPRRYRPNPSKQATSANLKTIASMIFDGFNDDDISFMTNLPIITIRQIRGGQEHPEVRQATIKRKARTISKLRDGTSKQWMRLAWWLERRYPQEFSKPEVQLTLGTTTLTNNQITITAEAASSLAKRVTPVKDEINRLLAAKRSSNDSNGQVSDK